MIYIKTDIGRQALKERSELMPRKYHFPFLMFDGKRDSTEILAASASHGFTSVDLFEMVQAGFIVPQAPAAALTAALSAAGPSALLTAEQFAKLKMNASHWLEDLLGPDAERLCLQLEECRNKALFDVALTKTVSVLARIKDQTVATEYQKKVLASL